MSRGVLINGSWQVGMGTPFASIDPATRDTLWSGQSASSQQVEAAFEAAHNAFDGWARTPLSERISCVQRFKELAVSRKAGMASLIAKDAGKLLWDATGEAGALAAKVDISLKAYDERTGSDRRNTGFGHAELLHRPHGVMAVLGPYNFPAHLPNGQIIPALIAGNTVVFKPSEHCPAVGEALADLYLQAGFPPGVFNMIQGARAVGEAILNNVKVSGVLFTGSAQTGALIHKHFGGRPEIVLALEMGGNNPLIVWNAGDVKAAASLIVHSAFITSGQRCTCARRLIMPDTPEGEAILSEVTAQTKALTLGSWKDADEASIGPLISAEIADHVLKMTGELEGAGAKTLRSARISEKGSAYVEPGLYDVTGCDIPDAEIFGPVLQIIRVKTWDEAILQANNTRFGLAAGLISDDPNLWPDFRQRIKAGVVNFNRPTTGASGALPFGGPGASGNHSPGAYYAADFCAWPMAGQTAPAPEYMPLNGMKL